MSTFIISAATGVAKTYPEECIICQDTLASLNDFNVSVLLSANNKRACPHYFHTECINNWLQRVNSCPTCKRPFHHIQAMPSPLENPDEWYRLANADSNVELNKQEVINALKATIPLDYRHVEAEVDKNFSKWDLNNSGEISLQEFKDPSEGLLAYVVRNCQKHDPFPCCKCNNQLSGDAAGVAVFYTESRRACNCYIHAKCIPITGTDYRNCPSCQKQYMHIKIVPDPRHNPAEWFKIIDIDGDGKLNKEEVIYAVKSTLPINWKAFEAQIKEEVRDHAGNLIDGQNLWLKWDHNNDGTICVDEFIGRDSLLDYVLNNYPIPEDDIIPKLVQGDKESYKSFFNYWDSIASAGDGNGQLSKSELTRALKKSFRRWHFNTDGIDDVVEAANSILDHDGNGEIDINEFCSTDGWAETILANLAYF